MSLAFTSKTRNESSCCKVNFARVVDGFAISGSKALEITSSFLFDENLNRTTALDFTVSTSTQCGTMIVMWKRSGTIGLVVFRFAITS